MVSVLDRLETDRLICGCTGRTVTDLVARASELSKKAHLEDIRESVRYQELTAKMQLSSVSGAREAGATWEEVGEALGVTHQAARQRWDRKLKGLSNGSTV